MIVDMPVQRTRVSQGVAILATLILSAGILLVVVANVSTAAPAHLQLAHLPSAPPASPSPGTSTSNAKQDRKLELEIQKLEEERSTAARFRSWLPIGSVIVALGAGIFGAYQYFHDSRRDSNIRVQEQFSTHLTTVAEYVQEDSPSSARLLSALTGLGEVVQFMKDPESHRMQVTDIIRTAALQDVDFDNPLQARFEPLCFDKWPDYRRWLSEHPSQHRFLLYRYLQAVRVLGKRQPAYFRDMKLLEDGTLSVKSFIDERDYIHFQQLLVGYSRHIALQRTQDRLQSIADFGDAINNRSLAGQLLSAERLPDPATL